MLETGLSDVETVITLFTREALLTHEWTERVNSVDVINEGEGYFTVYCEVALKNQDTINLEATINV
jgi:hypothetical protein